MATVTVPNKIKLAGGSFLIEEHATDQVFTLEDLSEEHQQIAQTTEEFARNEILPNAEKIEHKEFAVTRGLIQKACEIGIANVDIPEQYGGSDMDKISSAIIAEHLSVSGSFSVALADIPESARCQSFISARRSRRQSICPSWRPAN